MDNFFRFYIYTFFTAYFYTYFFKFFPCSTCPHFSSTVFPPISDSYPHSKKPYIQRVSEHFFPLFHNSTAPTITTNIQYIITINGWEGGGKKRDQFFKIGVVGSNTRGRVYTGANNKKEKKKIPRKFLQTKDFCLQKYTEYGTMYG